MEAISNAGSCVGILAKDGVVLAAEKRITSKVRLRVGSAWLAGWLAGCGGPSAGWLRRAFCWLAAAGLPLLAQARGSLLWHTGVAAFRHVTRPASTVRLPP